MENGYKVAGTFPIGRNAFGDHHFVPADNLQRFTHLEDIRNDNLQTQTTRYDEIEIVKRNVFVAGIRKHQYLVSIKIVKLDVSLEDVSPVPTPSQNTRLSKNTQFTFEIIAYTLQQRFF